MASASSLPLEEHITCNVCLDIYKHPHALRCLHTYCYECLLGVLRDLQISCPDCREITSINDIKKDFKTQSLVDHFRTFGKPAVDTDAETPDPSACNACQDQFKGVGWFCEDCKEYLCGDCHKAHKGSKVTKGHTQTSTKELYERKQHTLDEAIQKVRLAKDNIQEQRQRNRLTHDSIPDAQQQQIDRVNQFRKDIIQEVDKHHDNIIEQIKCENTKLVNALDNHEFHLIQNENELDDKLSVLNHVSESEDIALLTNTLCDLSKTLDAELQQCQSCSLDTYPGFESLEVQGGEGDWDPKKSTKLIHECKDNEEEADLLLVRAGDEFDETTAEGTTVDGSDSSDQPSTSDNIGTPLDNASRTNPSEGLNLGTAPATVPRRSWGRRRGRGRGNNPRKSLYNPFTWLS